MWSVVYDDRFEKWLDEMPPDIKAKIVRIIEMITGYGPENVREPYVKSIAGHKKLFEIRAKGKSGIARVFYFTFTGKKIVLVHGFVKKTSRTPKRELKTAVKRMKEVFHG